MPAGSGAVDVTAVVVNFNSSPWLGGLIDTLRRDRFSVDGREGRLEILVIDNCSRREDHMALEALRGPDVRVIRNGENLGYALANNQGLAIGRGRYHLVTNPDVRVIPGCITELLRPLQDGRAAITGPLATMDSEGVVLMPPNELADPWLEAITHLSAAYPGLARYNLRRRARHAWSFWLAPAPFRVEMLSGAFFMGRRDTFLEHGLFDPGYPLYYEDTDLFRRFHEADLELWHVPGARIVHLLSRSVFNRMKASMHRNYLGAQRYFSTWFGPPGRKAWETARARGQRGGRARDPYDFDRLDASATPPTFELAAGEALEVAGSPIFSLAAGLAPGPGRFRLPAEWWSQLGPGDYWVRKLRLADMETVAAWAITKSA